MIRCHECDEEVKDQWLRLDTVQRGADQGIDLLQRLPICSLKCLERYAGETLELRTSGYVAKDA